MQPYNIMQFISPWYKMVIIEENKSKSWGTDPELSQNCEDYVRFLWYNVWRCHSLWRTLGCLAWSSCLLQHGSPRCSPDPYHTPQASLETTPPQLNLWSLHCKPLQCNQRESKQRSKRKVSIFNTFKNNTLTKMKQSINNNIDGYTKAPNF